MHRDLKPENILIDETKHLRLVSNHSLTLQLIDWLMDSWKSNVYIDWPLYDESRLTLETQNSLMTVSTSIPLNTETLSPLNQIMKRQRVVSKSIKTGKSSAKMVTWPRQQTLRKRAQVLRQTVTAKAKSGLKRAAFLTHLIMNLILTSGHLSLATLLWEPLFTSHQKCWLKQKVYPPQTCGHLDASSTACMWGKFPLKTQARHRPLKKS